MKVDLSAYTAAPTDNDAIDIDRIEYIGESIVMPDGCRSGCNLWQQLNIDQVSNLTDNDHLSNPSVSYESAGLDAGRMCCGNTPDLAVDFKLTATATGGQPPPTLERSSATMATSPALAQPPPTPH